QKFWATRIAEVDVAAELPREIDLLDGILQCREFDVLRTQDARNDLPDAAVSGQDHARILLADLIEIACPFRFALPGPATGEDDCERRERHRYGDGDDEDVPLHGVEQIVVLRKIQYHIREFTAAGEHGGELHDLRELELSRQLAERDQHRRLDEQHADHDDAD